METYQVPRHWVSEVPFTHKDLVEIISEDDDEDIPSMLSGASSFGEGSMSRFFRGRVRWRRNLVHGKGPGEAQRPFRHPIRGFGPLPSAPNSYYPQVNRPFVISFPERREKILKAVNEKIDSVIPEPYHTMEKTGKIVIPEVEIEVRQTFDDKCKAVLQWSESSQGIHNHEGTLRVDLWNPGQREKMGMEPDEAKCVNPGDLKVLGSPFSSRTLKKGSVLHVPKGWLLLISNVDNLPHTTVAFSMN